MTIFNRCYQGGKKHKFQARYSEVDRGADIKGSRWDSADSLRRFCTLKVYEKDVCVWCGLTVQK